MADQKISQLTTESSLSGTYYFPVIKYNTGTSMYDNYKVDVSLFITSDDLGDGASLIGIEDSGALITATTVEGALAENRTAIDAIEADYLTSTAISSTVQAYSANLDAYAGVSPSANALTLLAGNNDDIRNQLSTAPHVSDRTALKALDTSVDTVAFLEEAGRQGWFVFLAGDYAAAVTADTQEGVYIKADDTATTSGAWVRVLDGPINVKWFGAVGDGVTNDSTACQAAIDLLEDLDIGGEVFFPKGTYYCGTTRLRILKGGIYLVGEGGGYNGGTDPIMPTTISRNGGTTGIIEYGDGGTTIVRGGGVRNLRLLGSGTETGINFNQLATHISVEDVYVEDVEVGFSLKTSCFSISFNRCVVDDYDSVGWDLRDLNHGTTINQCRTVSSNTVTGAVADIRIGITAHCSSVSITDCTFDHWGTTRHIYVYRARGLNVSGNYFEAKDTEMVFSLDLGVSEEIGGASITGNRFLGVSGVPYAIRLKDIKGAFIAGNEFGTFDTSAIQNADTASTALIGANDWNGLTEVTYSSASTGISFLDGSKIGLFGKTPIAQPSGAAQAALTNSTGGTGDGTLSAVGDTSVGDESGTINNNFTELHTLLNALRTALVDAGIIKGSA